MVILMVSMSERGQPPNAMPDIPDLDFVGALVEMWFVVSYAAYHLAYVRVYLQTAALQTHVDVMREPGAPGSRPSFGR
jgi:hypothetical protein